MIFGFHVCSFADGRMDLSHEEKVKLYCSADQFQRYHGPMVLICDEYFYQYIVREGLESLYMDVVPLPECEAGQEVETALKTAPVGYVYVGLDAVIDGPDTGFSFSNLFQAQGPDLPVLSTLPAYPARTMEESVSLLEDVPGWIAE